MSAGSSAEILVLSNIQAKALAGSLLAIGEDVFWLKDYDPAYPGQPPWRSGAEGKAYPLLARDGAVAAYLKFFTRPTQRRLNRTAWLIGQQMHTWLPGLAAAPLLWVDTRLSSRSAELDFDFAGYLAQAVPGDTWLEVKNRIVDTGAALPDEIRWRCIEDLVLAAAVLERAGIVHGDLSPNNLIVDPAAPPDEPALYLIDFDAFVAAAAGPDQSIDVASGGTYGTEGYCPPDLGARAAAGDESAAPYSDRYGRDMLDVGVAADGARPLAGRSTGGVEIASGWSTPMPRGGRRAIRPGASAGPPGRAPGLFAARAQRPTSMQLAAALGLTLPESPVICAELPAPRTPSAIPGIRSISAHVQQRGGRPAARAAPSRAAPQSRQAAPSRTQPLSQWLVSRRFCRENSAGRADRPLRRRMTRGR